MSRRSISLSLAFGLALSASASVAGQASGSVTVPNLATITASHAVAYRVRDQRNARTTQTEILLSDVAVDAAALQAAFDPHATAINLDALRDRNYVLLWVDADGRVSMNATFSPTMTQILDDTTDGLKVAWTTNSPLRLEGRVFSEGPLKTMDGRTYTVDLRFGVDIVAPAPGQALPAGGGEPGRVLAALVAAAEKKDWNAIKAASGPSALRMFDKSYNTPAENATEAADLLKVWLPEKMVVTGGQLRGDVATLDVEGELFPGQLGLSIVQMVRTGPVWQFERAARAGAVR